MVAHLQRLIPGTFEWDVQLHAPYTWTAPFPTKTELMRTINYGAADLKNVMYLKFEEFEDEENLGQELPTVWMRVTNLPRMFKKYEVLWAIGTMFWATQKVDMISARRSNFGRFQVGVLDPALVPTQMDVVICKRYLELKFVIEEKSILPCQLHNLMRTKEEIMITIEMAGIQVIETTREVKMVLMVPTLASIWRSAHQNTSKDTLCKRMEWLRSG